MTLTFTSGNIFDSGAQALVVPVNCIGIMGAGLAKEFKNRFEETMFEEYIDLCNMEYLQPGVVSGINAKDINKIQYEIVFFPTKYHYKDKSKLEWIVNGLKALKSYILETKMTSIAIPALGCGLGGLNWIDVSEAIFNELNVAELEQVDIIIYRP